MNRTTRWLGVSLTLALFGALLPGRAVAGEEPDLAKAIGAITAYKFGDSRAGIAAASELFLRLAKDPAQRKEVEKRLVAILRTDATRDGKEFVCRELSILGSADCVPALAELLPDKDFSHMARFALERIPAPEAAAALRAALATAKGKPLAGIATSLGVRRDPQAAAELGKLLADAEDEVATAAAHALGQIGGPAAIEALAAARGKPAAPRRGAIADAYLECADKLVAQGKKEQAAAIYKEMHAATEPKHIRVAALRGLLAADEAAAAQLILGILRAGDPSLWPFAAAFVRDMPGAQAAKVFAGEMAKLAPQAQVLLLGALASRRDAALLPAVLAATKSEDEGVRIAALGALGQIGDAASVKLLVDVAASGKGREAEAARRSLQSLRGKDVDAAIAQAAQAGPTPIRVELIRVLAARSVAPAAEPLLKNAEDPDEAIRTESLRALAALGSEPALPALVAWLVKAKAAPERAEAEKALIAVAGRAADTEKRAEPVLAALPNATGEARCSLLRVLGRIPSSKALAALQAATKDANAEVQDAAVRALADWPTAEPAADLLAIARESANPTHKVLAFRGYARLLDLPSPRPTAETAKMYAEAMAVAARPDEKKLVLGGLAKVYDFAALDLALPCLADKALEAEAAAAVIQIAKVARKSDQARAKAAIEKVLEVCKSPSARQAAENALFQFDAAVNLAPSGIATSPDGIESDGAASGDQAAIDNNPETYWDEEDGKNLYRLVVTFKQPERIAALSVLGHQHHQYAPKDFDILCDDKVVKSVRNAQYDDNFLVVRLDEITCRTVELKITGYYGNSPAIRELGIYAPGGKLPKAAETPKK